MSEAKPKLYGTMNSRILILAGMVISVTILMGLLHSVNVSRFGIHLSNFKNDNVPRFKATYRLEDWSYSILSGVGDFSNASTTDDLRNAYNEILQDIVGLEASASDQANYTSLVSNLKLYRLIEALKHSLNTTLALKTAALKAQGLTKSNELLSQISLNQKILLQDLQQLRNIAVQNRAKTLKASQNDLLFLQRRTELDSYWVFGVLVLCLTGAAIVARRSIVRMRIGLKEVSNVLRREQPDFTPDFFAFEDEFSVIGEKVQHYINQEKELREAQAKAAESELRAEAYEGAIANLTHDLQTPASAILGLLTLIDERQSKGSCSSREMQMAKVSANRLLAMIQDVLDITRSEMDLADPVNSVFNPKELFQELVSTFQFHAEIRKLELHFDDQLTLTSVVQDDQRIQRIVANLIDNAIKYTNEGCVNVTVSNPPTSNGRSEIRIEVKDTGIGIPDQQLKEIFDKFARAQNHFAIDGLGLGLALVSNFTDLLGGSVTVHSEVNRGTVFRVSLPCDVRQEQTCGNALEGTPRTSISTV